MEINWLERFVAVADARNFSKAGTHGMCAALKHSVEGNHFPPQGLLEFYVQTVSRKRISEICSSIALAPRRVARHGHSIQNSDRCRLGSRPDCKSAAPTYLSLRFLGWASHSC